MKAESARARTEISKDEIIDDLKEIGLRQRDHVAVTLSFKSIGYVKGGPDALIDALLEVVGPNGTIMMNTFTRPPMGGDIPVSRVRDSDYIFDYRTTPTWTGLVPETLRKREGVMRSHHPVCSVAATGKLAKYLIEGHDENSGLYDLFTPYSRLASVDGRYLCIGLRENPLVAIRHEAQRLAGLFEAVPRLHGVKYMDSEGNVKIYFYNVPPCARKLPDLVPVLRKMGVIRISKIGFAYSIFAAAENLLNTMASMLKKNPTLNLCDKMYCLWCREFERRSNIYKKVENPKFFQRNLPIMKTIALINNLRLRKYSISGPIYSDMLRAQKV